MSFPLPDTDWEGTREFWAAAERGELVIPRCEGCGAYNWYPPKSCQKCGAEQLRWTRVSGRGKLYSWGVVQHAFVKAFADKVPYVTGLVALEEDPSVRLVTTFVDCKPEELEIGLPMRVVFRPLSFPDLERQVMAPMFTREKTVV